jgi:S1-C subfamily serine protease
MKKATLYSNRSSRPRLAVGETPTAEKAPPARAWRDIYKRNERVLAVAAGALLALALVATHAVLSPAPPALTQDDIDHAVARTLQAATLPSPAAKAYEAIAPSVVRVRAIGDGLEYDEYAHRAVGSGVVIVERGVILTNLHVVAGASRIMVTFADGHESSASVVSTQPENDLAVIQAADVPDDLVPATLASADALRPGDHAVAVGFPFGIGPSTSAGVISGLRRQYRSPHGERMLSNLIQFDAAANPGSSGGPLVNAAGEVIGIVTAILSPNEQRAFAGIAFAVPIETAAAAAGLPPF